MGKPTRSKRTVAQKVLDFAVNVDAQKSLMNGPVLNRIMKFIVSEDKVNLGQTCRFASKHVLKHHVDYYLFYNWAGEKTALKAGQVISFKDYEAENPMNGFYKIKKIDPSGVTLYRLTREYCKSLRKRHFFIEWGYDPEDEESLVKRLKSNPEFEWGDFTTDTVEIIAENKEGFLPYWEKHCASVFPTRNKIAYDNVKDTAWDSKRRSKFVWILEDGKKQYPPCCY